LVEFQLRRVLAEKDPRKIEVALRSLPRGITDAYQEILERVVKEENSERVFKILSWVFHAKEPLLMDELREALSVEPGDTELCRKYLPEPALLLDQCKSLITYDRISGIVRLTHTTVHQFLQAAATQHLLSYTDLAKTLLTYLSFDLFKEPCDDDLQLKARREGHLLSRYAARWWPEYARGEGERDPELQNILFRLFQSPQHTQSVLQIEAMTVNIPKFSSRLIHFATFHRLAFICRLQLESVKSSALTRREISTESGGLDEVFDFKTDSIPLSAEIFGNVHSRDGFGETPLHIAARLGCKEIVRLLIDANADINAKSRNSADMTPLHLAITRDHNDVVKMLVKANADLEAKGRYAGETPLLLAAFLGRVDAVNILLRANADFAAVIEGVGETAIMRAFNSPEAFKVIESLLKSGADVNAWDAIGMTALHYALMSQQSFATCKKLLKLLLSAGAYINIQCTMFGNTPLHSAACIDLRQRQYEQNLRSVEEKFSEQSINEVFAHQYALRTTPMPTPEHVGGATELVEIVDLLLRAGADCAARNLAGHIPLQCAIKSRNPSVARLLFHAGGGRTDIAMSSIGDRLFFEAIKKEANGTML
jgi:ankyrin repeat protein